MQGFLGQRKENIVSQGLHFGNTICLTVKEVTEGLTLKEKAEEEEGRRLPEEAMGLEEGHMREQASRCICETLR